MRRSRAKWGGLRLAGEHQVESNGWSTAVRLFWPRLGQDGVTWSCKIEVGGYGREICQGDTLGAVDNALMVLSSSLYGLARRRIGSSAVQGYLGLPCISWSTDARPSFILDDHLQATIRRAFPSAARARSRPLGKSRCAVEMGGELEMRLYPPRWSARSECWTAAFEIEAPVGRVGEGRGASSLQALYAAYLAAVDELQQSSAYRSGRLRDFCFTPVVALERDTVPTNT